MNPTRSRFATAAVALLAAAALALSACSATGDPAAATIDGHDISRHDLQQDLKALARNQAFVKNLQQQGFPGTFTSDAVPARLTSSWLTTLVQQQVVDSEFDRRGLEVTGKDRAAARKEITSPQSIFGPASTFDDFPQWFQDDIVDQQARTTVLRTEVNSKRRITDAAVRKFYDQNKDQLCPSGRLVSHILVQTSAEAEAIEAQLAQGASFDQLAEQLSTDKGSATVGGRLTCVDSQDWSRLDETFRNAAAGVAVGTVSQPVQTQYGFHVIRVEPFTFENAAPLIRALLERQADPFSAMMSRRLRRADITVDKRYGRVTEGQQGFAIAPPRAKTPRSKPETSSTTAPGAVPAPGGAPSGGG